LTYSPGKDSGRYWDAGATNVHWLIATDAQVDLGITQTLARVNAPGVFIEGNSFTEYVRPDFFIMVARAGDLKLKPTARQALTRVSAVYLSDSGSVADKVRVRKFLSETLPASESSALPVHGAAEFSQLISLVQRLDSGAVGSSNPGD
jgi:hypothetical protein